MANTSRILAVADAIEKEEIMKLDMHTYYSNRGDENGNYHLCGCVSGFSIKMYSKKPYIDGYGLENGRTILDLTAEEACELFGGHSMTVYSGEPAVHGLHAVQDRKDDIPNALRWMAANNKYEWKSAFTALDDINATIEFTPECQVTDDNGVLVELQTA